MGGGRYVRSFGGVGVAVLCLHSRTCDNKDVPTPGWRFSSCAPCSAFVDGVNTGSGSFWDSTSPSGSFIPCIVPLFLYSIQADPVHTKPKIAISFVLRHTLTQAEERTSNISANYRLEWYYLGLAHEHRPPAQNLCVSFYVGGHLVHISRDKVVGCDIFQLLKPEQRHFRQNFAFAGYALYPANKSPRSAYTPQKRLGKEWGRSGVRCSR